MLHAVARDGEKLRVNDGIDMPMAMPLWQEE